jgi:FdhE protein
MTPPGTADRDGPLDAAAPVRLPDAARTFEARAARFRDLARLHAAGPYLELLAAVAEGQALCGRDMSVALDAAALLSPIPLRADSWPRSQAWRHGLDRIVGRLAGVAAPAETVATLSRLAGMAVEEIERTAGAVLARGQPPDEAATVFVAAALQAYWTSLAALVPPDRVAGSPAGRCPVCGSPPVSGVVLASRALRYLSCSLCATSWHVTRLTCAHCGSPSGLSYYALEGGSPGVKAEACARCHHYLKLFYLEQLPGAEPVADDVASLALDLLMREEGFSRAGTNPFLLSAAPR